jgi:hypothetical protein
VAKAAEESVEQSPIRLFHILAALGRREMDMLAATVHRLLDRLVAPADLELLPVHLTLQFQAVMPTDLARAEAVLPPAQILN